MEGGYETRAEASKKPGDEARRWLLELKLADKRERPWREQAEKIWKKYRGQDKRKNSFNILWANTEILREVVYNSTPKPDVRRRFRSEDILGKAVSQVLERGLQFSVDSNDFDGTMKMDILDALLPGRGISRVRYVPSFAQVGGQGPADAHTEEDEGPHAEEPFEGESEELDYEQVVCEHVQWDDFRRSAGKTWEEITWIGFKHRLRKDDVEEQFGSEIAEQIKYDATGDEDVESKRNEDLSPVFRTAEFWEIWDKESKRVFFTQESRKDGLIFPLTSPKGEPPLRLKKFWPMPRPLEMVEDSSDLVPKPIYLLYQEQADELDRLSARINRIINALKVRGVYDSTMTELSELMKGDDNEMIPAENSAKWINNGGIEKAIWWMPIEHAAKVLSELYAARDAAKQVIYELTGIADIMRGATNPNETLGAQELKTKFASVRSQRMQREVARYVRDLIQICAEVIGEHFSQQTLAQMTGLHFPTAAQKQQAMAAAQEAAATGQQSAPPDPAMMQSPTWEDIMAVLQSDMQREYRVDVETDSIIASTLQNDMAGLAEVLGGLVKFWQGAGPAVQAGALPIEAVKSISMTICRRARMGLEVEDAIEKMKEPNPPAAAQDNTPQIEAAKMQQADALHQREMQQRAAEAQMKAQAEAHATELEHQREQMRMQFEAEQAMRLQEFERWKVDREAETRVLVAEISAKSAIDTAQMSAAKAYEADQEVERQGNGGMTKQEAASQANEDARAQRDQAMIDALHHVVKAASGKKRVVPVRDASGRIVYAEHVPTEQ
jgi:hypothetical protein